MLRRLLIGLLMFTSSARGAELDAAMEAAVQAIEGKLIAWRRDIHANPELSNREHRTAALVAAHLRSLGIETRTGVAHTGVVGVLRGAKPGAVVALRADMDALPVAEETGLPFASTVKTTYLGREVGVMHACGHDSHVAMLLAAAEVLAAQREHLTGTIKFIFQPAEEGPPEGEDGGAKMMIAQGVLEDPVPDAVFGLHVLSRLPSNTVHYRAGPLMASADTFFLRIRGKQTHGAVPWGGVDSIVVGAQVVLGLQTIASRQMDVTQEPLILTVGTFHAGTRHNIIPDVVEMSGTLRTYDAGMRRQIMDKMALTAERIAASAGATAELNFSPRTVPAVINSPALTERMLPALRRIAGADRVFEARKQTVAEDFSLFGERLPALFLFLGVTPPEQDMASAAANHSPRFFIDESALPLGVRLLSFLALDFLAQEAAR